ncbi:MAG: hypothetical protein IJR28_08140 [Ottowia sp.]|nr:hypothetical protein [Ottowia sp.]
MNTSNPFASMFPGFDFMRQAASGVAVPPGLGSWIPTLDPKELDSRINELKTVLFWLEQNAAIVKSTMQALEVQKMTLGTLGAMNVGMAEMARAFTMPPPAPAKGSAAPAGSWPFASPVGAPPQEPAKAKAKGAEAEGSTEASAPQATLAASMAAPAQMWWNALATQFQQLAGNVEQQQVMVEAAAEAAKARTAATAKAAAEVAEAAAEVAEAAAEVAEAAAAVQAKPRKRAAKAAEKGEKEEKEGKEEREDKD